MASGRTLPWLFATLQRGELAQAFVFDVFKYIRFAENMCSDKLRRGMFTAVDKLYSYVNKIDKEKIF